MSVNDEKLLHSKLEESHSKSTKKLHDSGVRTICICEAQTVDLDKEEILWEKKYNMDVYRCKGVISVQNSDQLHTLQSYIVYLGSHSHGSNPSASDIKSATNSHYNLLGSHLGSHEKAKEAIFYSYNKHINGFAAVLEEEEAAKISTCLFPTSLNPEILEGLLASVGGVMAFLTLHEMIPLAFEYAGHKQSVKAVFCGMAFMSASLYFLRISLPDDMGM